MINRAESQDIPAEETEDTLFDPGSGQTEEIPQTDVKENDEKPVKRHSKARKVC